MKLGIGGSFVLNFRASACASENLIFWLDFALSIRTGVDVLLVLSVTQTEMGTASAPQMGGGAKAQGRGAGV